MKTAPATLAGAAMFGAAGVLAGRASARREQTQLREMAFTDPLTGLVNRAGLHAACVDRSAGPVGVLLVDLDSFKPVNDTFGHGTGDAVLVETGRRVRAVTRLAGGVAARLGGDEFVALVDATDGDAVRLAGAELAGRLAAPYRIGPRVLDVGASVGGAWAGQWWSLMPLLAAADAAMYAAKRAGGGLQMAAGPVVDVAAIVPEPRRAQRRRDGHPGQLTAATVLRSVVSA